MKTKEDVLQALVAPPETAHAGVPVPLATQKAAQPRYPTHELTHRQPLLGVLQAAAGGVVPGSISSSSHQPTSHHAPAFQPIRR